MAYEFYNNVARANRKAEIAYMERERRRRRLCPIFVEEGKEPPKSFTFESVTLDLIDKTVNKTVGVTHYIYKSRKAGWRISFTDREMKVGIDTKLSNKARGILTIENYWRDRG